MEKQAKRPTPGLEDKRAGPLAKMDIGPTMNRRALVVWGARTITGIMGSVGLMRLARIDSTLAWAGTQDSAAVQKSIRRKMRKVLNQSGAGSGAVTDAIEGAAPGTMQGKITTQAPAGCPCQCGCNCSCPCACHCQCTCQCSCSCASETSAATTAANQAPNYTASWSGAAAPTIADTGVADTYNSFTSVGVNTGSGQYTGLISSPARTATWGQLKARYR